MLYDDVEELEELFGGKVKEVGKDDKKGLR